MLLVVYSWKISCYIFICYQNKSSFRVEELSVQIENHFNKSLSRIYPEFNERCEFVDMDGKALELYDDDYLWYVVIYLLSLVHVIWFFNTSE